MTDLPRFLLTLTACILAAGLLAFAAAWTVAGIGSGLATALTARERKALPTVLVLVVMAALIGMVMR